MAKHQTFKNLVTSTSDFVGMVAYTIYKNEKINWIESFNTKNGQEPTQAEIESGFNVASDTAVKIQQYRSLAEDEVNQFIEFTLSDEINKFTASLQQSTIISSVTSTLNQVETTVSSIKKRDKSDIWFAVWTGVASTFIVALLSFVVWLFSLKNDPAYAQFLINQAKASLGVNGQQ